MLKLFFSQVAYLEQLESVLLKIVYEDTQIEGYGFDKNCFAANKTMQLRVIPLQGTPVSTALAITNLDTMITKSLDMGNDTLISFSEVRASVIYFEIVHLAQV